MFGGSEFLRVSKMFLEDDVIQKKHDEEKGVPRGL